MTQGRIIADTFWGKCRECGAWREVLPEPLQADQYFEYWRAIFTCCCQEQTAWFTIEKVDDDVH